MPFCHPPPPPPPQATLREGVFVNNTGGMGGGMMVENAGGNAMDGAAVSIINTIFEDNTAANDATGGAIACTGSPKPTIGTCFPLFAWLLYHGPALHLPPCPFACVVK